MSELTDKLRGGPWHDGLSTQAADEIERLTEIIEKGIRVNVKLNDKRQISYISNYEANATVVMDE